MRNAHGCASVGLAVLAIAAGGGAAQADGEEYFRMDAAPLVVAQRPPRVRHQAHPAWFDFGLMRTDITARNIGAAGSNQLIVANTIRFGIAAKISRHFYAGGDTDFGTISDSVSATNADGRSSDGMTTSGTPAGEIHGSTGAIRALAGVMAGTGGLTGSAELAAGYRIDTTDGRSVVGTQAQQDYLVEGRGRLSMFITPTITLGAVAGVDLRDHRDVSIGLTLGLHLYNWNHH